MKVSDEIKTIIPTVIVGALEIAVNGPSGVLLGALIDSLSALHSQRAVELLQKSISQLDVEKIDKAFLESEEFLEILERSIEIVARTASEKKRKYVSDYLCGIVQTSAINDIHSQLLEDLNTLQEFHLQILAALPDKAGEKVLAYQLPDELSGMEKYIYTKAICDLQRFGFLIDNYMITDGEPVDRLTTEYLVKFKETFR